MKTILSCIFTTLLIVTSCYSQERNNNVFDETLKNWIFASTSYVEKNYNIVPKPVNNWLLNAFYAYPREKGIYKSFNGSMYEFIKEDFKEELNNQRLYFIQEYIPFGHNNNNKYYILNSSNQLIKVANDFVLERGWEVEKPTTYDFQKFREKFISYSHFESAPLIDNAIYSYYIITEFYKSSVKIKVIVDYLEL